MSLFSGIGAFEKGLERLKIPYELVGFSEIDKWAITSYCAIHNIDEYLNLGDVSKVDIVDIPDCDLVTYGFPCQDISIAGKQKGIIKGETRSGLLYEALRIIEGKKPKYAIAENVKNLVGKKFKDDFNGLLDYLHELGYNNYWQVLNTKDYGIPQNRERVFIVSIRKDVDNGHFEFPKGFDNGLRLKDVLEDEVEEKYYINNERVDKLLEELKEKDMQKMNIGNINPSGSGMNGSVYSSKIAPPTLTTNKREGIKVICAERGRYNKYGQVEQQLEIQESKNSNALTTVQKDNLVLEKVICEERRDEGLRFFKDNVCGTIRTIDAGGDKRVIEKTEVPKPELVGGIGEINFGKQYRQGNRVYDAEKTAMCLLSQPVGNTGGHSYLYAVKEEKAPNELQLFANLSGGKWDKIHESARRVYEEDGIAPTIPTCGGGNIEPKVCTQYKIRKLIPKECWRLMGFSDNDFDKARQALIDTHYNGKDRANSQLYKQAGNSIAVDVLVHIYKNLFKDYIEE